MSDIQKLALKLSFEIGFNVKVMKKKKINNFKNKNNFKDKLNINNK